MSLKSAKQKERIEKLRWLINVLVLEYKINKYNRLNRIKK
jgi:hypothetical protein